MSTRAAVICAPVRTPIGRAGGSMASIPAAGLAKTVIQALLARTGIDPARIDDVILGQCNPNGEAPAIGRVAALDAGLPLTTGGMQVDRRCGSGLQAILQGVMQVESGASEVVVAGGVESMSQVEHYSLTARRGGSGPHVLHDRLDRSRATAGGANFPVPGGMVETAENVRREYGITREEQDELALQSHRRAVAAQQAGSFADEIVPVTVVSKLGSSVVDVDEHPRSDTSLERLAALRPVMAGSDPDATVTAGNSSGQNDAAAACIVTTRAAAEALGLEPMGRIVSWAVAGVHPASMGIGPVPATDAALGRAGLKLSDIDLIELNEAFAAQVLACLAEWGFGPGDQGRLNVNGSGISLGHPVGATGARIMATLLHEMRRRGARYGLETMCIGGGQGLAAVIERVEM